MFIELVWANTSTVYQPCRTRNEHSKSSSGSVIAWKNEPETGLDIHITNIEVFSEYRDSVAHHRYHHAARVRRPAMLP